MKNNKKGLIAIVLGVVAIVGSLVAIISIQSKGTYAASTYTVIFRRAEGDNMCADGDNVKCITGPDGKITQCSYDYSSICTSWSLSPCKVGSNGICASQTDQSVDITSAGVPSHVFTGNVTYYCKAGSSKSEPPFQCTDIKMPSSSSSKPSSSTPSSTPSSSSSSEPENPPTGTFAIYMVWAIGLGALIYAMVYFKKLTVK